MAHTTERKGFHITGSKGFHMTFENGFTISVQFGMFNYCDNKQSTNLDFQEKDDPNWGSNTAEIAVFHGDNMLGIGEYDQVIGWLTPDEVGEWIERVRNAKHPDELRKSEDV
jgi:hypothetical protein